MLICELMFSLDSKWLKRTNKIILPTPDNSVCFVLSRGYLGNTGNLYVMQPIVDFDYVE